jgi:hypothetical protein
LTFHVNRIVGLLIKNALAQQRSGGTRAFDGLTYEDINPHDSGGTARLRTAPITSAALAKRRLEKGEAASSRQTVAHQ